MFVLIKSELQKLTVKDYLLLISVNINCFYMSCFNMSLFLDFFSYLYLFALVLFSILQIHSHGRVTVTQQLARYWFLLFLVIIISVLIFSFLYSFGDLCCAFV